MIQGHCPPPLELIYSTADSCTLKFFLTHPSTYDKGNELKYQIQAISLHYPLTLFCIRKVNE